MATTILIVDDSLSIRQSTRFILEQGNYSVREASDGVEALKSLSAAKANLVITDINMPNMDGVTLVKRVRAGGNHASTPILILTTESGDERKASGKAAGATGWIVKPFAPEKLLSVVNKVCPA